MSLIPSSVPLRSGCPVVPGRWRGNKRPGRALPRIRGIAQSASGSLRTSWQRAQAPLPGCRRSLASLGMTAGLGTTTRLRRVRPRDFEDCSCRTNGAELSRGHDIDLAVAVLAEPLHEEVEPVRSVDE